MVMKHSRPGLPALALLAAGLTATPALADTLAPHGEILNIAHRGASGHAPEETMPAYDKAVELNADWLELDAQLTADGHLVAFHDESVDRTTNAEGPLSDYTLDELQALDAGTWFNEANPYRADPAFEGVSVPTLKQIVETHGTDQKYYIEIKSPDANPGLTEKLVKFVEKHGLVESDSIVIQSFPQEPLKRVHEMNPDIPLVQLVWYHPKGYEAGAPLKEWKAVTPAPGEITQADLAKIDDYAIGIGTNMHYKDRRVIDEAFVNSVREAGLGLHVYTIDSIAKMHRLIDWGATGIFTNFPDRLSAAHDVR